MKATTPSSYWMQDLSIKIIMEVTNDDAENPDLESIKNEWCQVHATY